MEQVYLGSAEGKIFPNVYLYHIILDVFYINLKLGTTA